MRYGVFMGCSRSIHGVFICIGYVSGMCRVCVGNATERAGSKKVLIQISCNVFQLGTFLSQVV